MRKAKSRNVLYGAMLALFIAQGSLHGFFLYDRWHKNYSPGKSEIEAGLSPDQILLQMFGFREFLAGILWVRADGFFDQGNYDAILPIIRLCTILDPKQIDIYATGMWHIGYNFTDEEQRSDRRYIPAAISLGKEGAKNNPKTYELFFETGWLWYHKIDDDYFQAVKWFETAQTKPDIEYIPARKNLLTNAKFRNGDISGALDTYYKLLDAAQALYEKDPKAFAVQSNLQTIEKNVDNTLIRMVQRGSVAEANGTYGTGEYDTKPPFDVGFSVKATVVDPFVLNVEGTWNVLPVGTRIRVTLRDLDYPNAKLAELDWDVDQGVKLDPDQDTTFMQDQCFVKNRKFNKKLDMSKDRSMYPFAKDKYLLEFFWDPRSAPPHIQDRFGYNGEGMTDKNFLRKDVRPGHNVIYTSFVLTHDQIWQTGDWVGKHAVVKTANFVEQKAGGNKDDLILVPALRSGK